MLHFASGSISGKQSLPRRTDSLAASKVPVFTVIDEELHDIRRVQNHGQEEDLKMALSKMISRVEELSSLLRDAYKVQTDLQTELTLAKSNLQLALANNEMLEDALRRDVPGSSKDVGWRRWSAKEQKERELEDMKRRSVDSVHSLESPGHSPQPPSVTPAEGGFFKFRFGGSSVPSPFPSSPRNPSSPALNGIQPSHLASASLPSLVPARDKDKELEDLTAELERERKARKASDTAKDALESELESLSQALFEEANKMVAEERMKLAETQEELRETQLEKDALRSALRLVESQHTPPLPDEVASPSIPGSDAHFPDSSEFSPSDSESDPIHRTHYRRPSSTSSAIAIKSPPSTAPSSPLSSTHSSSTREQPTLNRAGIPYPIQVPPIPVAQPAADESPTPSSEAENTPHALVTAALPSDGTPQSATSVYSTPSPDPEFPTLPSISAVLTQPTQTSVAQFSFVPPRPLSYFEEAESPWA